MEMLTPMGMRQRYLLGKYQSMVHHRFGGYDINTTNLPKSNYKDLTVQSTDLYRTIQSGYSELLGLTNQTESFFG